MDPGVKQKVQNSGSASHPTQCVIYNFFTRAMKHLVLAMWTTESKFDQAFYSVLACLHVKTEPKRSNYSIHAFKQSLKTT